jgi:hypothetical protein
MDIQQLYQLISAVAPIESVNSDGVISFLETATVEQRAAAHQVVNDNLPNLVAAFGMTSQQLDDFFLAAFEV